MNSTDEELEGDDMIRVGQPGGVQIKDNERYFLEFNDNPLLKPDKTYVLCLKIADSGSAYDWVGCIPRYTVENGKVYSYGLPHRAEEEMKAKEMPLENFISTIQEYA